MIGLGWGLREVAEAVGEQIFVVGADGGPAGTTARGGMTPALPANSSARSS